MFNGLTIVLVEPGTVIRDEKDNEDMMVEDGSGVIRHTTLYVTRRDYEAIKASPKVKPALEAGYE